MWHARSECSGLPALNAVPMLNSLLVQSFLCAAQYSSSSCESAKQRYNNCLAAMATLYLLTASVPTWWVSMVQSEVGYATQVSTNPFDCWVESRKDWSDWSTSPPSILPAHDEQAPARQE